MIYVVSKAKHAPIWLEFRDRGYPIISTWIDRAGPGQIEDWGKFWEQCITEVSRADWVVAYRQPHDQLKGGLIEMGAALAYDIPIIAVGFTPTEEAVGGGEIRNTILNHPLIYQLTDLGYAMESAKRGYLI